MTDHRDSFPPLTPPPPASRNSSSTENVAAEDLVCLQSAIEEWQSEREHLLARSQALETDTHAKLQHAELRAHQVASQLEATKRSAHAVRVRLEAEVQAARARAQEAQARLAASQEVGEQLRVANAELSTAVDAAQWRLGELEAESTTHRETLRHLEQARHADHQCFEELKRTIATQQQATAEATAQRDDVAAVVGRLQARVAGLEETIEQLRAERAQLGAALDEAQRQRADERRECEALQQRLGEFEAERGAFAEREAALQRALEDLQAVHTATGAASEEEIAALRAQLIEHERERHHLDEQLTAAHADRQRIEAQQQSERDTLTVRLRSLEEALQHRDTVIEQLRGVEDAFHRLQATHADELNAWHAAAAQHEADLVAARDALVHQLADEQALTHSIRSDAATLSARLQSVEADLQAARDHCARLDQQLTAAHADRAHIEAEHQTKRASLEDELRQRGACIDQLHAERVQLEARETQVLQAVADAARQREQEWHATNGRLQEELDSVRRTLADTDAARTAAQQRSDTLAEQLEKRAIEFNGIRGQAEAAAALAQQNARARVVAEQHATDLQDRHT